jgi:hypothetical protein
VTRGLDIPKQVEDLGFLGENMRVEISGSEVKAYTYDSRLEKRVLATPTEEMLDFASRLKNITYTTDSDKLNELAEKIGKSVMEKEGSKGIGYGYMRDNAGNLYDTEIGIIWYHKSTDDLEKTVNEVFQNQINQHVKWKIYFANIEGENVLLECRKMTAVPC